MCLPIIMTWVEGLTLPPCRHKEVERMKVIVCIDPQDLFMIAGIRTNGR